MIEAKQNRLLPDELCLKWDDYWRTWNRVLFIEKNGPYWVELNLTPINPHMMDSWRDQIEPLKIRLHLTALDPVRDRIYRHVQKNKHSIVFQEVRKAMLRRVGMELVHRMLFDEFLTAIDWNRYTEARSHSHGGGIPFELCRASGGLIP
jgi:hypothetical protein